MSLPAFKAACSGVTIGRWVRLPRTSAWKVDTLSAGAVGMDYHKSLPVKGSQFLHWELALLFVHLLKN